MAELVEAAETLPAQSMMGAALARAMAPAKRRSPLVRFIIIML